MHVQLTYKAGVNLRGRQGKVLNVQVKDNKVIASDSQTG